MPEKMSEDKRAALRILGARVVEQVGEPIGAFVAGAGTGGTLTGVGRRWKRAYPNVRIVLADPAGSGLADGVETGTVGPSTPYAVEGIGASRVPGNLDRSVVDASNASETTRASP